MVGNNILLFMMLCLVSGSVACLLGLLKEHDEIFNNIAELNSKTNSFKPSDISNRKTRVFISGVITNDPYYKEKFKTMEERLRKRGFIPVNPVNCTQFLDEKEGSFTHGEYMRVTLALLDLCDEAIFLNGWDKSKGARIERNYASENGKTIIEENELSDSQEGGR